MMVLENEEIQPVFDVLMQKWVRETGCSAYSASGAARANLWTEARRQVEERKRRGNDHDAKRYSDFRASVSHLLPKMQSRDERTRAEAFLGWIRSFVKLHDIDLMLVPARDTTGPNYAVWRDRQIFVRPVIDDETFAVALHETGHILAGSCPGVSPHYADPKVRNWHHCLACEADAWREAMRVAPAWTAAMHLRMRSALATYVDGTRGLIEVRDDIERLTSDAMFADKRLRLRLGTAKYYQRRLDAAKGTT